MVSYNMCQTIRLEWKWVCIGFSFHLTHVSKFSYDSSFCLELVYWIRCVIESIEHISLAVFWSCKYMCIRTYVIVDLSNPGGKGNWRSNSVWTVWVVGSLYATARKKIWKLLLSSMLLMVPLAQLLLKLTHRYKKQKYIGFLWAITFRLKCIIV